MAYLDEKSPVCKPPVVWWIKALSVEGVTEVVDVLFKPLQWKHLLIQQQLHAFSTFISCLCELVGIFGPLTSVQVQAF